MSQLAKVGSIGAGKCYCHSTPKTMTGVITTGSLDTKSNGVSNATVGSVVVGLCGHTGVITTGSDKIRINGIPAARVGDAFAGCFVGVIIAGSEDTLGT